MIWRGRTGLMSSPRNRIFRKFRQKIVIIRRIWSFRFKRWRNAGWKKLPVSKLYGELGLVKLISLIPSIAARY